MGYWSEGKRDCENPKCPLYEFSPYKKNESNQWFMDFDPKKRGRIRWQDIKSKRKGNPEALKQYRQQRKGKTNAK
jgi:hypothetical protein